MEYSERETLMKYLQKRAIYSCLAKKIAGGISCAVMCADKAFFGDRVSFFAYKTK
jgi:hypothetical protein